PIPLQRATRSAGARTAGCAASGRRRTFQSFRPTGAGSGAVLPQRVTCLPDRGGASYLAQPHGRIHVRVRGPLDGVWRRLGAWLRRGRKGAAAEPAPSRLVLGTSVLRRVSQG